MMSPHLDYMYEQDFDLELNLKWLGKAMAKLSPKEIEILYLRYGLGGEAMTLQAINKQMNLSIERVRQIECRALLKLRVAAYAEGGNE